MLFYKFSKLSPLFFQQPSATAAGGAGGAGGGGGRAPEGKLLFSNLFIKN